METCRRCKKEAVLVASPNGMFKLCRACLDYLKTIPRASNTR